MPQFLAAVQLPDNYDPSLEGEEMIRDIHALNAELDAAGVRLFAGGLEPASKAKTLRKQPDGEVVCRVPVEVRAIFFRPRNKAQA